jgi:type IV pilus assembly protein PilC
MKFQYKARTKEGELQVGDVEASNRETALNILFGHGLFVLSIEEEKNDVWYERILGFLKRVKVNDVMIFTRQFATLLASQVSISDSLINLFKQTTNPILKEAIYEISNDVDAGFSLSQAFEKHPGIFSDFYINMVRSAEVTGRLSEVMDFLADYLEKQALLKSKVQNALAYPVFVVILFFVVILIMVTFVFPQIMPVFEEANVAVPFYTTLILKSGIFIGEWWWAMMLLFAIFIFILIDYLQTKEGRLVLDEVSLHTPVVGKLLRKMYIARFAESTRVLIRGGLTIPQAIEISSRTVGNKIYEDLLQGASEQIRKGKLLSKILEEIEEFPPLVSQLVSIGESTGRLEELLKKVNDFYTREVEDMVNNLVTLIQPLLMVIIGGMIALLFAAILLPLYSLTQSF